MNVELTEKNLFWEVTEVAETSHRKNKNFTRINSSVENLIDGAESCVKMISNRRNIKNKEFYDMLLKFAYITDWSDYDCCKVLELAYNMKFVDYIKIKTTMHTKVQMTEGHGKDFSWWTEEVGIDLKIAYTKDFKIDYKHVYSIDEIKKLLDEKKILVISEEYRNYSMNETPYEKEEHQKFDGAYDEYSWKYRFFHEKGKFFPYTLIYIRNKVNKKKLLKLFEGHLEHTNSEIFNATHKSSWNDTRYKKTAEEYSEEFNKQGYAKRLEKLNEFRNNIKDNSI